MEKKTTIEIIDSMRLALLVFMVCMVAFAVLNLVWLVLTLMGAC
jgi:uncharacterized membrane protein YesL